MSDETPWRALRQATGLDQREVERRLGWKSGHLSLYERGVRPTPEREAELKQFYATTLLAATDNLSQDGERMEP